MALLGQQDNSQWQRSADAGARLVAACLGVLLVAAYIGLGAALYPIVNLRLGGWFTWVCWSFIMVFALNLFVAPYSFVANLWLYGDPKRRKKVSDEADRQRRNLEVMTARSKQMYGDKGPPESMSGDESADRSKHRDVGVGRRR